MRPKERIKRILRAIEELWNMYPDQRLGQLLTNYVFVDKANTFNFMRMSSSEIFNQEDDETEEKLLKALNFRREEIK